MGYAHCEVKVIHNRWVKLWITYDLKTDLRKSDAGSGGGCIAYVMNDAMALIKYGHAKLVLFMGVFVTVPELAL